MDFPKRPYKSFFSSPWRLRISSDRFSNAASFAFAF
jgi:hypothetical protein